MILLLAANYDDARRWEDETQLDDKSILIVEPRDVAAHASQITPGARIIVTDRCSPSQGLVSALQAVHARIGLVDPTGLLGPLDPDRQLPASKGPYRSIAPGRS